MSAYFVMAEFGYPLKRWFPSSANITRCPEFEPVCRLRPIAPKIEMRRCSTMAFTAFREPRKQPEQEGSRWIFPKLPLLWRGAMFRNIPADYSPHFNLILLVMFYNGLPAVDFDLGAMSTNAIRDPKKEQFFLIQFQ
ncbi:hypothetical protein GR212_21190 [Rhizobium lusitanum]|uniref:Uncharacterized protein n=1 Tax=Rhizobium lusitanum TaxID=293958 RepID=A0A6L9U9A5_9HYPH|nr:hypothetical protein [Rhizobium lusitanum]NEI72104.1 hypothetical protein [Rhizobium lusitanum]